MEGGFPAQVVFVAFCACLSRFRSLLSGSCGRGAVFFCRSGGFGFCFFPFAPVFQGENHAFSRPDSFACGDALQHYGALAFHPDAQTEAFQAEDGIAQAVADNVRHACGRAAALHDGGSALCLVVAPHRCVPVAGLCGAVADLERAERAFGCV